MINISPQVVTGKLPSKVVVPTIGMTEEGRTDIKFKPRNNANAGHYILIAAAIAVGLIFVNYKVNEIDKAS